MGLELNWVLEENREKDLADSEIIFEVFKNNVEIHESLESKVPDGFKGGVKALESHWNRYAREVITHLWVKPRSVKDKKTKKWSSVPWSPEAAKLRSSGNFYELEELRKYGWNRYKLAEIDTTKFVSISDT